MLHTMRYKDSSIMEDDGDDDTQMPELYLFIEKRIEESRKGSCIMDLVWMRNTIIDIKEREDKIDGLKKVSLVKISNQPFHFTVDRVTHLMTRSPYIKLSRPFAFREMERVEQKTNNIRYDGYHEWGCRSHKKWRATPA